MTNVVNQLSGIDEMRCAVNLLNHCDETFLQQFSPAELLKLYGAFKRSEWYVPPDGWTARQVREALHMGRAPTWADEATPTYDDDDVTVDVRARAEEILETSADEDSCVLAHWVLEHLGVPYRGS